MTLVRALEYKWKHQAWTWKQCVYFAKQDMAGMPRVDPNALIYGICAVAAAVLVVAPWLTRAGCGV